MLKLYILLLFVGYLNYVLTDPSPYRQESLSTAKTQALSSSSSKVSHAVIANAKKKCGKNQIYDLCPSSCPPRTCETKDVAFKCKAPLEPGNPNCPRPKCRCADNYYSNNQGECVLKEQCPTINCGTNEIYEPCPVPICFNQTCENIGKAVPCPLKPDYVCKAECRCKSGYYRNKIGQCISEEDCKKCTGDNEYFACDNACDNECDKLSRQSHANCPIVNIQCNPMCYCLEGYARDENNKCIPISQCPPECKENEFYSKCPNSVCHAKTCDEVGFPVPCIQIDANSTDCGEPGCICQSGYVKNKDGKCIPTTDCPSCGGDPNAWSGCGVHCTRCSNYKSEVRACPRFCQYNACDCRTGYVYDDKTKKCVLPENCSVCGKNEVYSDCPKQVCQPEDCCEIGFPLACNQIPRNSTDCGKPGCICKPSFIRNKDGECVDSREVCPSCGGDPNAWSGCGNFCTQCDNYKDDDRACSLACKLNGCDCRPNYVYNRQSKKCVLPNQCPVSHQ